jgi:hypothetical protein
VAGTSGRRGQPGSRLPAFDEHALGFTSFKQFLQRFPELVTFVDHDGGGHEALIEPTATDESTPQDPFSQPRPEQ